MARKTLDVTFFQQSLQANLAGALGYADAFCQIRHGQAAFD